MYHAICPVCNDSSYASDMWDTGRSMGNKLRKTYIYLTGIIQNFWKHVHCSMFCAPLCRSSTLYNQVHNKFWFQLCNVTAFHSCYGSDMPQKKGHTMSWSQVWIVPDVHWSWFIEPVQFTTGAIIHHILVRAVHCNGAKGQIHCTIKFTPHLGHT